MFNFVQGQASGPWGLRPGGREIGQEGTFFNGLTIRKEVALWLISRVTTCPTNSITMKNIVGPEWRGQK